MTWDESFDVVVIGSGISGLSGGLTAAIEGASVVVLEKADRLGGSTSWSYGLLWIGGNRLAQEQGFSDSKPAIKQYMDHLGGGQTDPKRLNAYIEGAVDALDYFRKAGLGFQIAHGVHDHYLGIAPGATEEGRTVEAELVVG